MAPGSQDSDQQAWIVRHGQTEWSLSERHTGRTDVPLTEAGREQAASLKGYLAGHRFVRVLVSPYKRALETCHLAGFGSLAETTEDLSEWDYGSYEGRTTRDIRGERPGWSLWTDGAPNGEEAAEVGGRIDRVVELVRSTPGDVVLFGHGHSLRVFAARWLGLPPDAGRLFALSTCTVGVLGYEREIPVMLRWNDQAEGRGPH